MARASDRLSFARMPFTRLCISATLFMASPPIGPSRMPLKPGGAIRHADSHPHYSMGFEYDKFKVQVKLAISRITSLQQKHQNSLCGRRKDIADLLKAGQEERARLQVPGVESSI